MEGFCAEFRRWRSNNCRGLDAFSSELVLREVLNNAALHGCGGDAGKRITGRLRYKPARVVLCVRDEGRGFDWRTWLRRDVSVEHPSGRGIKILTLYSSSLRFNRSGNAVTVIHRFKDKKV